MVAMLSSGRNRVIVITGTIVVMLTAIIFSLVTRYRTEVGWTGLAFILIAEIAFFVGLVAAEAEAKFSYTVKIRAGIYAVLSTYMAAAMLLSIIFLSLPSLGANISLFKVIQVLFIAITAVILLILVTTARTAAEKSKAVEQSVSNLCNLMNRVLELKENPKNLTYCKQLETIYEAIKYSDLSSTSVIDPKISNKISELENLFAEDEDVQNDKATPVMEQIIFMIKQRSAEIKTLKEGRI
jgi:hypothetical protein